MESVQTLPERKRQTAVRYSDTDEAELKSIAKKPRNNWKPYIDQFVALHPDREYTSVYAKVNSIAKRVGNLPPGNGGRSGKVKKNHYVKKGSKKHPMKNAPILAVSEKELRFPFKSVRLENGEVIISI